MSAVAATVRSWDPEYGGSAFLDDGTVVPLPPECLQGSVFRFLRSGQRVRLHREGPGDERVTGLELPSA